MNGTVLVVDDEENIRRILAAMLRAEGYDVVPVATLAEARATLRERGAEVVLSDLRLDRDNGREDGLQLLRWMREQHLTVPFLILTAHGTVDSAVDAMKQGAFDYLTKPFERTELARVIRKAMLTAQFQAKEPAPESGSPMVGRNERILRVGALVDKVAPTDATVLITGESGTGKELVAQALHDKSARAAGPFIKINCAAIPDALMESELFGHERGAFTGALSAKPGRFELADGGTLFLDEIGELSPERQVKLLRVLQERSFERVGGLRTIRVDVRLVTATNRDLELAVREGGFRGDLFYRLNVVPVHLPALRERADDIPLLASYFLRKACERLRKKVPALHPECLELLAQFPWPGNIRQLENVMERLSVMSDGSTVMPETLPEEILEFEEERFYTSSGSLKEQVREVTRRIETKAIEEALLETANNVTQAARKLNLSRKGLQLKMKELGIR
jgi:DNA-binding NtrC family response regulator